VVQRDALAQQTILQLDGIIANADQQLIQHRLHYGDALRLLKLHIEHSHSETQYP
jgi:hypothetical protein